MRESTLLLFYCSVAKLKSVILKKAFVMILQIITL